MATDLSSPRQRTKGASPAAAWAAIRPTPNVSAALFIALLVAIWTVYSLITNAPLGVHPDETEAYAWSTHFDWSYAKHPPLESWIAGIWFAVFPPTRWAFDLLSAVNIGATFWVFWLIGRRYLPPERQLAAIALQSLNIFITFQAFRYNANSVQMPWWALSTLFFLQSFERRHWGYAAAAGVAAALAILAKYYAAVLIPSLAVAALWHPDRWKYFRSPAPWISVAVASLCLVPHIIWLSTHQDTPLGYADAMHDLPRGLALVEAGLLLVSVVLHLALSGGVYAFALRPRLAALRELALPGDAGQRQRLIALAAPIVLSTAILIVLGKKPTDVWTVPAWSLLAVVCLAPPSLRVTRRTTAWIVASAIAFWCAALVASPFIALALDRQYGQEPWTFVEELAPAVEDAWHAATKQPLRYVTGSPDIPDGLVFYAADRPRLIPNPSPSDLETAGFAIVCVATDDPCLQTIAAATQSGVRQVTLRVRSSFLGRERQSPPFVIGIVPPAPPG